ncbi:hypothetical protein B9Q02_11845 [Candidatus Marsarchaeota G1 archaeon BE_D]|jgi:Uncharacterized conserved protein|uniref:ASCH domain-containing protein n=1 Tax=Candidatus Marsarchaeota G1 archaeon BE_D TaxID=1978156 RepID=A0A2R6A780_9ARCH|nr:MAG: hypothetical protein B9Q02_11845 [Candidatus Marsarchaeota G1 archaeon BE_D]
MIKIVQGKKRSTIRELNRFTRNIEKGDKITFTDETEIVNGKHHAPKVKVQVEDVKVCKLGELTDEDARAEGYQSVEEIKAVWSLWVGGEWDPEQTVKVIRFKLLSHEVLDMKPICEKSSSNSYGGKSATPTRKHALEF